MIKKLRASIQAFRQNPAYGIIFQTINHHRRLIAVNFNANLFSAVFEGSSFGLIYLALRSLESSDALAGLFDQRGLQILGLGSWLASQSQTTLFIALIALAIALQYLRNGLEYVGSVSADYLSARIQAQMTEAIFGQVMGFSFACASRYKVGDLTNYITGAAITVNQEIRYLNSLVIFSLTAIAQLLVLVSLSPLLSLLTLVVCSGLFAIQKALLPRIRQTATAVTTAQVEVAKQITESIQGLRVLHTFASQGRAIAALNHLESQLVPQLEHQSRLLQLSTPLGRSLTLTGVGVVLVIGFAILQSATAILPTLLTFLAVLNRLTFYVNGISSTFGQLAQNSGNFSRLETILSTADKEFVHQGQRHFTGLKSVIEFEGVALQYPETDPWALKAISFTLKKGQVMALVGGSGAGKSSIADLLIGLYQPTQGVIWVDGVPLSDYRLDSWRQRLGVVSQDTFIFNASVLDNIRYGCPEASVDAVIQVAIAAQADGFIQALPNGYDTIVGERGYRLSGGQRQRLALARAILKVPDILILDEATSALDSQSEHLIQQALNQFQQNCTVLVIAHRLSTIVDADQIVVLEQGSIQQRGTHQELLAKPGLYRDYWQRQSQQTG